MNLFSLSINITSLLYWILQRLNGRSMIQEPLDVDEDKKFLVLRAGDFYVPMGVLYLISNFSKQVAYELLIDSSRRVTPRPVAESQGNLQARGQVLRTDQTALQGLEEVLSRQSLLGHQYALHL